MTALTLADRYELQTDIAYGGASVVWKAHDQSTDQTVAVKVLHPDLREDSDTVEAFFAEAEILAQLDHPGIIAAKDFLVCEDATALVLEYVPGGDVRDSIRDKGPFAAKAAAIIVASVADALAYLHQRGYIHGDIKPANILLPEGGGCKLIDFGLVRRVENRNRPSHGTPEYTAPEVVQGEAPATSADVYALGLVLFEMLTGCSAYRGGDMETVLQRQVEKIPACPNGIDDRLWSVLAGALALRSEERPSAAVFAEQLRGQIPVLRESASGIVAPQLILRSTPHMFGSEVNLGDKPEDGVTSTFPFDSEGDSGPREKRKALFAMTAIVVALAGIGLGAFLWVDSWDSTVTEAGEDGPTSEQSHNVGEDSESPGLVVPETQPLPTAENTTESTPDSTTDDDGLEGSNDPETPAMSDSDIDTVDDDDGPNSQAGNGTDTSSLPGSEHIGSTLPGWG